MKNTRQWQKRQGIVFINGMAFPLKRHIPYERNTIPKKLAPLVRAFSADEQSAKTLIVEATKAIYTTNDSLDQ